MLSKTQRVSIKPKSKYLTVWSEQFATLSKHWGTVRQETLEEIQDLAQRAYENLVGGTENSRLFIILGGYKKDCYLF